MTKLAGKVAVITGGSSGIGLASAKAFVREGAQVVITGRRAKEVDAAVTVLGQNAVGLPGDVAHLDHHDAVANLVRDRFGGLDIYLANAGLNIIEGSGEVTPGQYDAQFATNTRGVFFGVQKLAPLMRDGGAIILTGSVAATKTLDGHAVYAGSKAAVIAFARAWALEFKTRGIRVNVLSPGPTNTPILDNLGVAPDQREAFERGMAQAIPLGRLGRPDELAEAALFLATGASSFITGVELKVDGGMSLF
jgi:NAD(P)-dependent dehydrogenase (short-subunit alcohol dehydrogenase family)